MKIFFSVGEPSGDLHGANLIRRLLETDPSVKLVGYGGPRMKAAGCELHEDLTQLAVMGIGPVLLCLHRFWQLATRADRYFRHQRPDAVILIDYPGFNWWIARRAKAHGIPVFYYGAPQLWAWASWRVRKMRRLVDHVLCKLPFEATWYRERGCNAHFVGHPYFDEMQSQVLDAAFLRDHGDHKGPLIAILPGSRTQEVKGTIECFMRSILKIKGRVPDARFAIACFKEKHVAIVQRAISLHRVQADVYVGRTQELMHLAEVCIACSGSVSLELLYHEKPTVIYYRLSRLISFLLRKMHLINVRFITLVNLLAVDQPFTDDPRPYDPLAPEAGRIPFPEYPSHTDKSTELAAHVIEWLTDGDQKRERVAQLSDLKARIAHGGASRRAADYILNELGRRRRRIPGPHFIPAGRSARRVGMAVASHDR